MNSLNYQGIVILVCQCWMQQVKICKQLGLMKLRIEWKKSSISLVLKRSTCQIGSMQSSFQLIWVSMVQPFSTMLFATLTIALKSYNRNQQGITRIYFQLMNSMCLNLLRKHVGKRQIRSSSLTINQKTSYNLTKFKILSLQHSKTMSSQ